MEITGKVHEILPTTEVTATFKKRELIIEYAENVQYPEFIKLEAHKDTCDKLDELRVGDNITVQFNLRGRPWTDKNGKTAYFNTLAIWKFQVNQTGATTNPSAPVNVVIAEGEPDDLPFN